MPVFDMLETYLVKEIKLKPSFWLRFTTRTIFVGQLIYHHLLRLCLENTFLNPFLVQP